MTTTILDELNAKYDLSDLLPCPFCGGQSSIATCTITRDAGDDTNALFTGYYITCASCGVSNQGIAEGYSTVEAAKAHWQTRTEAALDSERERMREACLSALAVMRMFRDNGQDAYDAMIAICGESWATAWDKLKAIEKLDALATPATGEGGGKNNA